MRKIRLMDQKVMIKKKKNSLTSLPVQEEILDLAAVLLPLTDSWATKETSNGDRKGSGPSSKVHQRWQASAFLRTPLTPP